MSAETPRRLYKIGEIARLSGLHVRTVDYYTKLGLIRPKKRSKSNYRLYGPETLDRLQRIESMKREKYTLEEIKELMSRTAGLNADKDLERRLADLQLHLRQLEREVKELGPVIDRLKPQQAVRAFHLLTPPTAACIEALLLLLGRGPII
jgi:DNA-binding transcriptional MerR regulator